MMTNLDVHTATSRPHGSRHDCVGQGCGVYGIRKTVLNESRKPCGWSSTSPGLYRDVATKLLRSAGIYIVEEISLAAPPAPADRPRPCRPKISPRTGVCIPVRTNDIG